MRIRFGLHRAIACSVIAMVCVPALPGCTAVATGRTRDHAAAGDAPVIIFAEFRSFLDGRTVRYFSDAPAIHREITLNGTTRNDAVELNDSQWAAFGTTLRDLRVSQWQHRYVNPNVFDGGAYSLYLSLDGKTIATSGSNAGPVLRRGRVRVMRRDEVGFGLVGDLSLYLDSLFPEDTPAVDR